MRGVLGREFELEEVPSRHETVEIIRDVGGFDVAIIDACPWREGNGHELSGYETVRQIRGAEPGLGIVVHGSRPDRQLAGAALSAGASAYIAHSTDPESVVKAVRAALGQREFVDPRVPPKGSRGKLTQRQRQLLQMLADGEPATVAAEVLGVSQETVKTHTKNILARLGARNRANAIAIAMRESLIE